MALGSMLFDSVRAYATAAQFLTRYKYVSSVGAAAVTVDATGGIDGGPCLDWGNAAGNVGVPIANASGAPAAQGTRFKLPGAPGAGGCLLHRYTADNDTDTHVGILVTSAMKLAAHKGTTTAGTLYGTGATTLVANRWYYLESAVSVSATVGFLVVKLWDDAGVSTTELSLSGLNTLTGSTAAAARAWVGPYAAPGFSSGSLKTMDHYAGQPGNTLAAATADLLGDVNVLAFYPNGAGTDSNGTIGGSAPTRWESVDDPTPDDDTTYVTLTSVSGGLSCAFEDVVSSSTVKGASFAVRMRLPAGSTGSIVRGYTWSGGVKTTGTATAQSNSAYLWLAYPFGLAWTQTLFNAIEFGFEVTAADPSRVTQMVAEVAVPRVATPIEQNLPAYTGQVYPRGGVLI